MRNLGWLALERVVVRAIYLAVTIVAAARLDAPSLAVALAANAIVGLPQSFGDQAVNGLVIRRTSLSAAGAARIRRTTTVTATVLAVVTAAAAVPAESFTGIPRLAAVGATLALIIPLAGHAGVSAAILQRAGRQRATSTARACCAALSGGVWLPVMAQTGSEWSLVGFYLTTDALSAASLWVLSRRSLRTSRTTADGDVASSEVLRFIAAVGPANCLYWLSTSGFGLLCAAGLTVEEYAELALYLAILRVGLDLVAGPFAVHLQVGLSRLGDTSGQDALIVRCSHQLTGTILAAVSVGLLIDPHNALGWIGKEQFDSDLLLWLLASLPLQATSWLDRPVLIHRHLERTDLGMRVWLAAADTSIALSSATLGLQGLGVAIVVRYMVARLALNAWFGERAVHCHFPQTWPALAFALLGGAGIVVGHGRLVMAVVGAAMALFLLGREVRHGWTLYSSTRVTPSEQ